MSPSPLRSLRTVLFIPIFAFLLPAAAIAQTASVEDGVTVRVQSGTTWDLEGGTMDFGAAGSTAQLEEQSSGRVAGGSLVATRSLSSPSSADPAGLGLQITASADLGDVTVTRGHAVQSAQNGNESIERLYDVSPSQNNSGLNAELTFTYNDAELNGRPESELEFFKSTDGGTSWSQEGQNSRDASANTVTLGGIESFSRWTLGSESAPLPVELAGFGGTVTAGGVELTWETTSETNNAGFEVQRRRTAGSEAESWEKIGFVDSKTDGTTTEAKSYRFTDADLPYAADAPQYRLRQVDVDGSETLTDPVTVNRPVDRVELRKTFPNPARHQVTVRFAVPERQTVTLQLYDVMGRRVRTIASGPQEGRSKTQIGLSDLSSGIYFLQLVTGGVTRTQKLTIVQ